MALRKKNTGKQIKQVRKYQESMETEEYGSYLFNRPVANARIISSVEHLP